MSGQPTLAEDRDAIRHLLASYNHFIDGGRVSDWVSLFSDDGVFDMAGNVTSGRDGLTAMAQGITDGGMAIRHHILNELIEVDGDKATSQCYLVVMTGAEVSMAGNYDDELQRIDGRWRFTKRSVTLA